MSFANGGRIVTDGLVLSLDASDRNSYISGSTTWNDLSGNGYNGTLTNGPTFSSANGGSIVFDGSNDYITITRMIQDDFTLSCWFKTTQSFGTSGAWYNGAGLIDGEVGGVQNDFGLSVAAGKLNFGVGNSDTFLVSSLAYNDDKWHYASATRTKATGTIKLYVDGQEVATGTGGVQSLTTPTNIRIGSIQTNINFFNGNIANVKIYNRALSASEVLQNYNAQKSRFNLK
jgi:hypothetical protein